MSYFLHYKKHKSISGTIEKLGRYEKTVILPWCTFQLLVMYIWAKEESGRKRRQLSLKYNFCLWISSFNAAVTCTNRIDPAWAEWKICNLHQPGARRNLKWHCRLASWERSQQELSLDLFNQIPLPWRNRLHHSNIPQLILNYKNLTRWIYMHLSFTYNHFNNEYFDVYPH